ncbi:hypothetical protein CCL45_gp10 [Sulfolobus islandicus rod-shaped virus 5]|uniref:Uncharacterized protein n=2 Tax=Usarudivirus SIRV5 TaxID=2846591 RepID=A0A1X9SKJ9_9VIRU|nr:hypothetical protein CCL43_gp09 [Sulfolobus islandicus rod-shaped virus 7]YP_009362620.1 hypothetical protein CCL45_gp10 [Sulfolobus islandicus rod-shaped virus 5]YP_009362872.1 hypothetical protein CCL44_gp10 [Sulfolobus islandicus rod-shaped phage 6]ARQ96579.1 hypothetical protein [Sulfolobus islandicus rod-shaped virus 7]ARQ96632.1 hypothetical protein [Sulfolobus islandicus rod-shaped virus 5]ARQ96739.1 hypothetical protein [Sulfolobus islandicus rod-shaped phage 6]
MKKQRNKYIGLRIPSKYKNLFYQKRELIKQEIDRILNSQKEFKEIEISEIYDERVFFTVDELYYKKLVELANKYNMKVSKLIRSIFFKLI